MAIEPYDSTIISLEKDLERKLAKKSTKWNLMQINNLKALLNKWKEERENAIKQQKHES